MDYIFIIKLLISFIIGAVWAIFATVAADRYGSKIGGLISGLPSTALFSLLFIAWTQDIDAAITATIVLPIIMAVLSVFVVIYIYLVTKKSFAIALFASYLVWFVLASVIFFSGFNNYPISIVIYLITLLISYFLIEKKSQLQSISGKKIIYSPKIILFRGLLSGLTISFVVFISKVVGPELGGIFAGFPAMFLSTILITYFSQGAKFSAATMKSAVFSVSSVVLYSIIVRFTYIPFGIVGGTLISIFISFTYAFILYRYFISKLK